MLSWFRPLLLIAAAFGASWIGAIWYWRASNRIPATSDLVLYLLLLPLALLLVLWIGRKIHRSVTAGAAAAATATPAAADAAPADTAPPVGIAMLAASVRAPHGASPDELLAALADGAARPELDNTLYDDYGFPIMTARIADIDVDALREDMAPWLEARGIDPAVFNDEQWRALHAGSAVVQELAAALTEHPHLLEHEARLDTRTPSPLPLLQLLPLWSAAWPVADRNTAEQWLAHVVAQAGWPKERIATLAAAMPAAEAPADVVAVLAALLARVRAPAASQNTSPAASTLALVLACDSHLSEAGIDRLSGVGMLFAAQRPQGQMPGEGAAGLLLADAVQAALLHPRDGEVLLRAVASAQLSNSADAAGRPDAAVLGQLAKDVLATSRCDSAAVLALSTDTDHRTGRVMETMGVLSNVVPQLDATLDLVNVGAACGSCGLVTYLTALALARQQVIERGGPVLCLGTLDPYRRDAALVAPPQQS